MTDTKKIIEKRGIHKTGEVQRDFTKAVYDSAAKYTPQSVGMLQKEANCEIGDDYIKYNSPYARFQYYGKVMVGIHSRSAWAKEGEQKEVLKPEKNLDYQGAPTRGARWIERMWAEKGREIAEGVAKNAGGRLKMP